MGVKLKAENGKVAFMMKSGTHLVGNSMPEAEALKIIEQGKPEKSDNANFPIKVGDFFFSGSFGADKAEKEVEEKEEEPKAKKPNKKAKK